MSEILCQTCLSNDRVVFQLHNIKKFLKNINIPVYNVSKHRFICSKKLSRAYYYILGNYNFKYF